MKYFKDSNGNVFAFEADGSQDHAIPAGLTPITEAEADQLREVAAQQYPAGLSAEHVTGLRRTAYIEEADPLFFKAQRGEIEHQAWLDKVAEIKARFPK